MPTEISIFKSPSALEGMVKAGKLARLVLDYIQPYIKPGISTNEIDLICSDFIKQNNATSACLNYRGYPKSICTSVNEVVCHGIPDKYILKNGDIVNVDVTVILNGWFGDTSRTFLVGTCSQLAQSLVATTKQALEIGIQAVKPYGYFGEIGKAIQQFINATNFSIVTDYGGHGIGNFFHGAPFVAHYDTHQLGPQILPGMFFTIEPMINTGKSKTKVLKDGWTAVTVDKGLSAQFEHTLAITDNTVEILTK